MKAKLSAEEDEVGSAPVDREEGRRVLHRLYLVRGEDPLAEALLRANALHLGINGLKSLSNIEVKKMLGKPWIYLKSTMDRHAKQDYFLPLPNVWIDLDQSWHRRLCGVLSDSDIAKDTFDKWEIYPRFRVLDPGHWLLRVLEATLLDGSHASPLLVGIANFRQDAALPGTVAIDGPFLSSQRVGVEKSKKRNILRSALRMQRKPGRANPVQIPGFDTLSQLDDPISRLVSLLLWLKLDEPSETKRAPMCEERYSRAQEEVLNAVAASEQKSATPLLRKAWSTIGTYWRRLSQHFSFDETMILENLITLPLEAVFKRWHTTNAGAYNLIPPSLALTPYLQPVEFKSASLQEMVRWAYMTLICRCGCRASDLYRISAKTFNGLGSPEMCVTLPFTKTTDRRTLPVGLAMPKSERDHFSLLVEKLLKSASKADEPWFSIITEKEAPERWQYDFAYADFRRSIAPSGINYLPTHLPRHAFATAFGLHWSAKMIGGSDRAFFRLWTQDSCVAAIGDSELPRIQDSLHDSMLLVNQLMGHKTPVQYVSTYCHAWPLMLAASAEARLPNCLPWAKLESLIAQV